MQDFGDKPQNRKKRKKRSASQRFKRYLGAFCIFMFLASLGYASLQKRSRSLEGAAIGADPFSIEGETEKTDARADGEGLEPPYIAEEEISPKGMPALYEEIPEPQMIWPVGGVVIREPGWYYSPSYDEWRYKSGIGISAQVGETVKAAKDGCVKSVSQEPGPGQTVTLSHEAGSETIYGGVDDVSVSVGAFVKRGDPLGKALGTDIYFVTVEGGEAVDPQKVAGLSK